MKLFKSKRVKELEDTIFQLQMTISDKNDYICHLKKEIEFLQGRNHYLIANRLKDTFTYAAVRFVPKYDKDIPEEIIKRDLAEELAKGIMAHLKIEKRDQKEFGTVYETRIQILAGDNK